MAKVGKFAIYFCILFVLLLGVASVIRYLGGDDDLMLWLLASVYCSTVATDLGDDETKSEKSGAA